MEFAEWDQGELELLAKFVSENPNLKNIETKNNRKSRRTLLEQLKQLFISKYTVEQIATKIQDEKVLADRERLMDEEQVINFFRQYPILWNTAHADYHNRDKRNMILDELEDQLEARKSKAQVLSMWNSLRSKFMSEKKLVTTSKNGTGKGRKEIFVTKLVHYETLEFLDGIPEVEESSSFDPAAELSASQQPGAFTTELDTSNKTPKSNKPPGEKRPRITPLKLVGELKDVLKGALSEESSAKSHESCRGYADPFGASVSDSLKKLSPLCQELAKSQIQMVLAEFFKSEQYGAPPPSFTITAPPQHHGNGYNYLYNSGHYSYNSIYSPYPGGRPSPPTEPYDAESQ